MVAGGYYSISGPPNPNLEIIDTTVTPVAVTSQTDSFLAMAGGTNLYPFYLLLPMASAAAPGSFFLLKYLCNVGEIAVLSPQNVQTKARVLGFRARSEPQALHRHSRNLLYCDLLSRARLP